MFIIRGSREPFGYFRVSPVWVSNSGYRTSLNLYVRKLISYLIYWEFYFVSIGVKCQSSCTAAKCTFGCSTARLTLTTDTDKIEFPILFEINLRLYKMREVFYPELEVHIGLTLQYTNGSLLPHRL